MESPFPHQPLHASPKIEYGLYRWYRGSDHRVLASRGYQKPHGGRSYRHSQEAITPADVRIADPLDGSVSCEPGYLAAET